MIPSYVCEKSSKIEEASYILYKYIYIEIEIVKIAPGQKYKF